MLMKHQKTFELVCMMRNKFRCMFLIMGRVIIYLRRNPYQESNWENRMYQHSEETETLHSNEF